MLPLVPLLLPVPDATDLGKQQKARMYKPKFSYDFIPADQYYESMDIPDIKVTVLGEDVEVLKDYDDFSDALKAETRDVVKDYVKQNKVEIVAQAIADRMNQSRREGHPRTSAAIAKGRKT